MFLSIIIPIYNDEEYLSECLDACLNQKLSENEYEIICIDDGSTDCTPEILQAYAVRHSNIRVITKEHGVIYGFGRDIGLAAAQGEYLWFVDHDDLIAPGSVDDLKAATEMYPHYDRICFPCYEFFNSFTQEESEHFFNKSLQPNDKGSYMYSTLWSGIIKHSFFIQNRIMPHSKRISSAGEFWNISPFRLFGADTVCLEECFDNGLQTKELAGRPLYHYRRHNGAETMGASKEAIERREELKFHSALLRGYLAYQLKEQYLSERANDGQAAMETTVAMILKIRSCAMGLADMSDCRWKEGVKRLQEKQLFFSRKPPEYTFSLWDYIKTRSLREKLTPSIYASYYTYSLAGARCYRFLTSIARLRSKNSFMIQAKIKYKQKKHFAERVSTNIKEQLNKRKLNKGSANTH